MARQPHLPDSLQTHNSGLPQEGYLVAASADSVYVQVVGLGTMQNTPPLMDFLEDLQGKGYRQFIIDLAACRGCDSTFLGLLIGIAAARGGAGSHQPGPQVILINVSAALRKLITSVGVDRVVRLCENTIPFPPIRLKRLKERTADLETHVRRVVEAHENLVGLDSRNREQFGAFLTQVQKELGAEGRS